MELTTRRRHAISTVLAVFLALESVAVVSAAAGTTINARDTAGQGVQASVGAAELFARTSTADRSWESAVASAAPAAVSPPDAPDYAKPKPAAVVTPAVKPTPKATAKPPTKHVVKATPRPAPKPVTKPVTHQTTKPKAASANYSGSNHVWIPSLGVNKSVSSFFACTRTTPPGNYVYRWGCAGSNNVYLMGHAGSVFRPLHDAYLNGRLTVGMKVYYADSSGTVHVYAVRWWKLTPPTTAASWAWAPQSVPSMTLQTCMGANSQYRLMVRLVQVG